LYEAVADLREIADRDPPGRESVVALPGGHAARLVPRDAVERMMMHARSGGRGPVTAQPGASAALHAELFRAASVAAQLPPALAERSRREVAALARSMDSRLPAAFAKGTEVQIALAAGRGLGLGDSSLHEIRAAVELLPLARFGLSDRILLVPDRLGSDDWSEVCAQLVEAARLVARVPGLKGTPAVVLAARERVDGSGYPCGYIGSEIPCESMVVGACEAYRALRSPRPWHDGHDRADALGVLCSSGRFDSAVLSAVADAAKRLD
jgi:response regulator RpfG family c-di-GMP phosphodiesterase